MRFTLLSIRRRRIPNFAAVCFQWHDDTEALCLPAARRFALRREKQSVEVILPPSARDLSLTGNRYIDTSVLPDDNLPHKIHDWLQRYGERRDIRRSKRAEKALRKAGGKIGGRSYGQFAAGKRAADWSERAWGKHSLRLPVLYDRKRAERGGARSDCLSGCSSHYNAKN